MVVLRLGWRNLWRNPRRSALAAAAVAVAFAVLIVAEGLREGIARQMLDSGTRLLSGHVQVHDAAYLPDRDLHDTLGGERGTDLPTLLAAIEAMPGVRAAAPRVHGSGLLSTGPRSSGAELLGIDPAREARVTRLLELAAGGAGLAAVPPHPVLLGRALAEELGVRIGDEVAVVALAADGSVGNDLFAVRGVFATGLAALDRSLALVRVDDLQALLALPAGRVHEVAARLDDPARAAAVAAALSGSGVLPPGSQAAPWERLMPALADYLRLLRGWNWVMVAIVAVFAALGVLNTMLMAVFERTHELGVLAALGLAPRGLLGLVVAESLCLAAVGLAAGLALGAVGLAYLAGPGWDIGRFSPGLTVAGVLMDPVLHAAWTFQGAPSAALALLAGLVPALRASRQRPVEALAAPGE